MADKNWYVELWEYERGCGCRLDEVKEFPNNEEAVEFAKKFNSKNDKKVPPDWYMVASVSKTKTR